MASIVKPGQVWKSRSDAIRVLITSHVLDSIFGRLNVYMDPSRIGKVKEDGTPDNDWQYTLESDGVHRPGNHHHKVREGQVWSVATGERVYVVEIVGTAVMTRTISKPDLQIGTPALFGSVGADGYPDPSIWINWCLEEGETAAITLPAPKSEGSDDLMSFFSAVRDGNCNCDIPRDQCCFHRL
jgi:hypothetical protein